MSGTNGKEEIAAMGEAYQSLSRLDRPAQIRAMRWLEARLVDEQNSAEEEPF